MSFEYPKQRGTDATGDSDETPLVVDVDGSLVAGDLLIEGIARMLADSPLNLFLLPFRLSKGRAACKRWVANTSAPPPGDARAESSGAERDRGCEVGGA